MAVMKGIAVYSVHKYEKKKAEKLTNRQRLTPIDDETGLNKLHLLPSHFATNDDV
jgi:hypothetical protein